MAKRRQRRRFGTVTKRRGRGPFYILRFEWKGRQFQRRVGSVREDAEKRLLAIEALLKTGHTPEDALSTVLGEFSGPTASLKDVADRFLAYRKNRRRASTLAGDSSRLEVLKRAPWATKPLGKVTGADLTAWMVERETAGTSGPTINRDLTLLSALFTWAERLNWVPKRHNPAREVERYSEKHRDREPCYLTAREAKVFVDVSCDEVRPLFETAIHTGARRGELLALEWRDVDLVRCEIRFRAETEKAGRGRTVPMTEKLAKVLDALRVGRPRVPRGTDRIFTLETGQPLEIHHVRRRFANALKATASVLDERLGKPVLAQDKRDRLRFHDLRHSAASLMVAAGVPIFDASKILGHSTVDVTMRYAHFAPEAGRAAIDALGRALKAV